MFLLRKPSKAEIESFVLSQANLPFSYGKVGATQDDAPKGYRGYVVDRYRVRIGEGKEAYERAKDALRAWRQFGLGWVSLHPSDASIRVGTTVAVMARHYGFWSLNSARIVYTVEEGRDVERFGFGYGTLPGHGERGEERFLVEHDRASSAVHYDVLAFSRPNHPLAWTGYPFARLLQRRFARDSKQAMKRAVAPGHAGRA